MTLAIQEYLRGEGTLESLAADYAVRQARHATLPHLVLLKYDQINSPMGERIVEECRGIILDEADDWKVVARAYDKFYNYGEPHAAAIDWTTARVQEKIDGTLCVFYHSEGWRVATTGFPDARGRAQDLPISFHAHIFQTATAAGLTFTSPEHTYLFELTGPHTRVVIPHRETRLTLLGIRHTQSGDWAPRADYPALLAGEVAVVSEFPLTSYAEILASFATVDGSRQEGYVVVDGAGNRVKVKHPDYVALHLLKMTATPKRYVDVLRRGEEWELLTYFPELEAEFAPIRAAYQGLCAEVEADYARLKEIAEQKAFAQEALKTRCPAALFSLRAGQCGSIKEFFGVKMVLSALLRLLDVRDDDPPAAEGTTQNAPST